MKELIKLNLVHIRATIKVPNEHDRGEDLDKEDHASIQNKLIPPNNNVNSEFNGSQPYLFQFRVVVTIKYQFHLSPF